MALRDHAIVAYAETKVMEKSDRDVFVLIGEMLESLLDSTGLDKNAVSYTHLTLPTILRV